MFPKSISRLVIPTALLGVRAVLGLWAIRAYSATFDEPVLLAAGWSYWKTGDMRLDPKSPFLALLWNSLPLISKPLSFPAGPEWQGAFVSAFAERLLFWNGANGDDLIQSARMAPLLLSLATGAWLWARCRRVWGGFPAAIALAFYCFSPMLLAHGSLATVDMTQASAVIAFLLTFSAFLRAPSRWSAVWAGAAGIVSFLCKYSALALIPVALAALSFAPIDSGGVNKRIRAKWFLGYGALPAAVVLALCFFTLPRMWQGFLVQMRMASEGAPVYAFGMIHPEGWRWFPLAALALKSTFPELVVIGLSLLLFARRRFQTAPEAVCAVLIAVSYIVLTALSGKQLGARYLLPVYAVLPFIAAGAVSRLSEFKNGMVAAALLAVWQGACALGTAPDFLPYFNELCGGAAQGHRCLGDSNLDWGQDLKRLGTFVEKNGNPEIILSYFGTASPETYRLRPQHLSSHALVQRRLMNSDSPRQEWLVVSRTNLQGIYAQPPGPPKWSEGLAADARVGYSLFVFDVTHDSNIHRRLAEEYQRQGDVMLAARELRRAARIDAETIEARKAPRLDLAR